MGTQFMKGGEKTHTVWRFPKIQNGGFSAKYSHYAPDGTGRDFYIKCDEGGQSPRFRDYSPHSILAGSLRTDRKRPPVSKSTYLTGPKDYFSESQITYPVSVLREQKILSVKQRELSDKLSTPKTVNTFRKTASSLPRFTKNLDFQAAEKQATNAYQN
eukprot:TRINITY_DN4393_c0_g1_i2.p1 TRINITY_DN4393_c0_g1~~TRINITY_DN4393_c0_g1_i2.p1  ORF type:complete len:158 (-),score=21.52 TRINITY_DN4393_c0_g1_i2:163-636(-)